MTYCCGILVNDGLVMVADTRTNAGLDNISTFRKLNTYHHPGERVLTLAASGNLSISQSVVSLLNDGIAHAGADEPETLMTVPTMFRAAQLVGRAVRRIRDIEAATLEGSGVPFDVAFLFGGQIKGDRMGMFMIYPAGNFIECTVDTPYLQVGEHKYGKPILDRAAHYGIDLYDALKIALLSMDSTLRSNLGVGMPLDIVAVRRDVCDPELVYRIEPNDAYFRDLSDRWSAALREAHTAIPRPPYVTVGP